jgi:hypothetical protein
MLAWIIVVMALMAEPILGTATDTIEPQQEPTDSQADVQAITQLLNNQYAAWNRQDLDGYLLPFWQSPNLIYVTEGQFCFGWQDVKALLGRDYSDRSTMGTAVPERIQVSIISDDNATTVDWWTVHFRNVSVYGISTSSWRKFPEGWRITALHTSASDIPR